MLFMKRLQFSCFADLFVKPKRSMVFFKIRQSKGLLIAWSKRLSSILLNWVHLLDPICIEWDSCAWLRCADALNEGLGCCPHHGDPALAPLAVVVAVLVKIQQDISGPSVADPDPGSGAFLTPGSGMGKKSGSGIRDEQPGSYFRELKKQFLGLNT